MDTQTLAYPKQIARRIGLSKNEIAKLKREGCPFRGRKTTVAWVRAYLDKASGAQELLNPTEKESE